jgi:type IV secretory pathway protease TraF
MKKVENWLKRKLIRDGPIVLGVFCLVVLLGHFLCFNCTASMPYGLYLRLPAWNLEEGDLVELDNPFYESFGVEAQRGLLKQITRIDGDFYEVQGEGDLSYDSTYFGLVGKEYIRHRIIPLYVFRELPWWSQTGDM